MPASNKGADVKSSVLSAGDVLHIAGPVTDDTLLAILKCEPTMEELEVAASYLRGEGSQVDRAGHPMTGKVAQIYDILMADPLYAENEAS
jgi:hypothetical protein